MLVLYNAMKLIRITRAIEEGDLLPERKCIKATAFQKKGCLRIVSEDSLLLYF